MAPPLDHFFRGEGDGGRPGLALLHRRAARARGNAAGEEALKLWFFIAAALLATGAKADENLWRALRDGGHVILIRHALTTPGSGDPPGMKLDDCATQRNLSDEGRAHARRVGRAFSQRKVPFGRVLSSPWCRCVETARLAFGRVDEVSPALSNLFGRPENRDKQVEALKRLVSMKETNNLVLVTHGSTIQALTGISPETGEIVVLSKGKVRGRLKP